MSPRSNQSLPDMLAFDLEQLGRAYVKGRIPDIILQDVMAGLDSLPPEAVPWADGSIALQALLYRPYLGEPRTLDWCLPNRSDLDMLESRPELAGLFMVHRDGYTREAALNHLGTLAGSPFLLAVLMWRLNDWVRPVRIAARHCAERLLPSLPAHVVADAAPFLLDRWKRWGRWEQENLALVDAALQRPDVAALLAERFARQTSGPLASLLRYALRGCGLDRYLPSLARNAANPAVRTVALQALLRKRASWPTGYARKWIDRSFGVSRRVVLFDNREIEHQENLDLLIGDGLRDRSAAVRRVAADALIERRSVYPDLDEAIATLATDRSPGLRERADFLIRERSEATKTAV